MAGVVQTEGRFDVPAEWSRRWSVGGILLLCAIVLLFIHAYSYNYVVDDAYISYRYASNLIEGHGLVFNPGERVEGYTNFLWVILTALGMQLGFDPVMLTKALCFIFSALAMIAVYRYAGSLFGLSGVLRALPVLLMAASPALAVWSLGGLETTMFAFLVTVAVLSHTRALEFGKVPVASSVAVLLASLTRPEGLLIGAVLFADFLATRPRKAAVALWLLPLVGGYLPYFIWRYSYYGFLFPNTFYAKTGGGWTHVLRGFEYVRNYFVSPGGWVYIFAIVPPFVKRGRKHVLPAVVCAVWVLYVIVIGGDGLAMYRFFVPVIPLLFLLAAVGLALSLSMLAVRTGGAAKGVITAVVIAAALLCTFYPSIRSDEKDFVVEDRIRVQGNWVPIGKWLKTYARPGESVAVTAAGALPYYSGLYTIDMLGINDVHIAHRSMPEGGTGIAGHEKYDMRYVLSKRPTYIFHYPFFTRRPVITPDQFISEWNPGERYLLESPEFRRLYEPVTEKFGNHYLNFFRLRSD
jgi:arabinofuranosyltransferase